MINFSKLVPAAGAGCLLLYQKTRLIHPYSSIFKTKVQACNFSKPNAELHFKLDTSDSGWPQSPDEYEEAITRCAARALKPSEKKEGSLQIVNTKEGLDQTYQLEKKLEEAYLNFSKALKTQTPELIKKYGKEVFTLTQQILAVVEKSA